MEHEKVTLSIAATLETAVTGGQVNVSVTLGKYIPLYHNTTNLCDEIKILGLECPIKARDYTIEQTMVIPPIFSPDLILSASLNVTDQSGQLLLCLDASITV